LWFFLLGGWLLVIHRSSLVLHSRFEHPSRTERSLFCLPFRDASRLSRRQVCVLPCPFPISPLFSVRSHWEGSGKKMIHVFFSPFFAPNLQPVTRGTSSSPQPPSLTLPVPEPIDRSRHFFAPLSTLSLPVPAERSKKVPLPPSICSPKRLSVFFSPLQSSYSRWMTPTSVSLLLCPPRFFGTVNETFLIHPFVPVRRDEDPTNSTRISDFGRTLPLFLSVFLGEVRYRRRLFRRWSDFGPVTALASFVT